MENLNKYLIGHILLFTDLSENSFYIKDIRIKNIKNLDLLSKRIKLRKSFSPFARISKLWLSAELFFRCKISYCNGKYDFNKGKCIKCGHIVESNTKKLKRAKKYNYT